MANPHVRATDAHVQIDRDQVVLRIDGIETAFPLGYLDALSHLLQAAQHMRGDPSHGTSPVSRDLTGPESQNTGATTPKRRSRKRVGDALVAWMHDNPGWHHENHLLDVVIEHEMTDASPHRALKIALGKQRGKLFSTDGMGRWQLAGANSGDSLESHEPTPPTRAVGVAAAPIRERANERRAGQLTEAARGITRARDRRLIAKPPASHGDVAGVDDGHHERVVRVKKGESRRGATVPQAATEPVEAASAGGHLRWQSVSQAELDRARRNLLGLGGSQPDGTTPEKV